MKVPFLDQVFDTETVNFTDDFTTYLLGVRGQNTELYAKKKQVIDKRYSKFDTITSRERAIKNLIFVLDETIEKLKPELFPSNIVKLVKTASSVKAESNLVIPAVDFFKYGDLQKMTYMKQHAISYLTLEIQARVGFGINLLIADDGTIYSLNDLRELFKAAF